MLAPLVSFALFYSLTTSALDFRPGLSASDRREVVRTVGFNSTEKILSNPYSLGGYDGFEIGYSIEFIDVRELRELGCPPGGGCPAYGDDTQWRYSRLTVGKGVYNDVDIFFSAMAPVGEERASDYGGILRWSFYQAEFLPINFSLLAQANQLNYADTFMVRNLGAGLVVGVNVDNFAMYFGGGVIESSGAFTSCVTSPDSGSDACVVDPSDPEVNGDTHMVTQKLRQTYTTLGFSLHLDRIFAAAEVDRYTDAVYSLKLGMRF